jgi:hypothetical protein
MVSPQGTKRARTLGRPSVDRTDGAPLRPVSRAPLEADWAEALRLVAGRRSATVAAMLAAVESAVLDPTFPAKAREGVMLGAMAIVAATRRYQHRAYNWQVSRHVDTGPGHGGPRAPGPQWDYRLRVPAVDHRSRDRFIAEPSHLGGDDLRHLLALVEEGCTITIDGRALARPGECVRVVVTPPADRARARGGRAAGGDRC